ncbi:hypothetical protein C8E89_1813, partial [Mycolicibacterium moriokaense]
VRAAKDGAVSGGQLCQSFADLQPAHATVTTSTYPLTSA